MAQWGKSKELRELLTFTHSNEKYSVNLIYIMRKLISHNFCENFAWAAWKSNKRFSFTTKNISCNQLFSNFFSKNVTFTKLRNFTVSICLKISWKQLFHYQTAKWFHGIFFKSLFFSSLENVKNSLPCKFFRQINLE